VVLANVQVAKKGKRPAQLICVTILVNHVPKGNTKTVSPVGLGLHHVNRVPLDIILPLQVNRRAMNVPQEKYPRPVKAGARIAQLASFNLCLGDRVFVRIVQQAKLQNWDQHLV